MELFTGDTPTDWTTTTPSLVAKDNATGRVHTGEASVAMRDGADLSQIVPVHEGCFYELSFFAHGNGAQVGLTATVTFIAGGLGLTISIRQQDLPNSARNFGFYKGITLLAPAGATMAEIKFAVTAAGNQFLNLDDVSFAVT
jgi:hypothetical protein